MIETTEQSAPPPPMFSVIVPVFNRAELVGDTIKSVLAQTCGDYELIVADDGSTDGTVDAVRTFGPRVQIFTQANKGEGGARNLGMSHARGEYLVFLDSDDLLLPWALETFAEIIGAHDQPALIYGAEAFFKDDERAKLTDTKRAPLHAEAFGSFLEAPARLFWRGVVGNVVRRDVAQAAGQFCEARLNALDIDYTLRCAAARGFVRIQEPLTLLIYHHPLNVSRDIGMNVGGIEHLIREEKAGHYPGGQLLKAARRSLVCRHARAQSVRAARAGQAAAAWRVYRSVFWWAVRLGRWPYVLGLPIVLLGGVVRKMFRKVV